MRGKAARLGRLPDGRVGRRRQDPHQRSQRLQQIGVRPERQTVLCNRLARSVLRHEDPAQIRVRDGVAWFEP